MRLLSLALHQFRSYEDLSLDLSASDLHLFLGDNGVGKTNILEAISVLSLSRSALDREEGDLVQWGKDFYRVTGHVKADLGDEKGVEVVSQIAPRKQKACFVNDVRVPVSSFVGQLPVVLFLPQDLVLFSGPPSGRRRFLDHILSQVHPEYFALSSEYLKIMKQRNTLLGKIADKEAYPDDLTPWDLGIAEKGALLTSHRLEIIEMLSMTLSEEMRSLGEESGTVQLLYERKGTARDFGGIRDELADLLLHYRERDILLQSTTIGPHRDDWKIFVDGRELTTFASRGQQRTAVLALLFLEVSYLGLRRNEKPVILLDDVFSELDDHHQEGVLQSFADHQVIITSTHLPPKLEGMKVWQVSELKGSSVAG
ncbi:DNA replication and repair protein RecF [Candidatus Peregrinibacteria bacterium]|nr:DNA replication and repair protein RecF [Candidatus Peregrinibacteria bacterium]